MTPHLETVAPGRHATLPLVPHQAEYPRFSGDPAIAAIHETLAELHRLAFIALYGPPPKGVRVRPVSVGRGGDLLQPRYLAVAEATADATALAWLEAFGCGLDRWSEVEMASPCVFTRVDAEAAPRRLQVHLRPPHQVLVGAMQRLAHKRRFAELRRLRSELGETFPGRFDPDGPHFVSAPPKKGK